MIFEMRPSLRFGVAGVGAQADIAGFVFGKDFDAGQGVFEVGKVAIFDSLIKAAGVDGDPLRLKGPAGDGDGIEVEQFGVQCGPAGEGCGHEIPLENMGIFYGRVLGRLDGIGLFRFIWVYLGCFGDVFG